MKLKYVIVGIIVIVIGVCCYLLFFNEDKIKVEELEASNIKSFYFGYGGGLSLRDSDVNYELNFEDNKYIAKVKPSGVAEENKLVVEVSKDVVEKLSEIFKKYKVNKWDGFNKSQQNVMDGSSFSLTIRLIDDKSIHASGYMKWPKNYSDVRDEINELFMDVYNKYRGNTE